jgi:hypothetical protein
VDNDIDGSVLTAQPGRSQGRPLKSRAQSPSRKKRPVQPAFSKKPLSQSAERTAKPGQEPHKPSFMPRKAGAAAPTARDAIPRRHAQFLGLAVGDRDWSEQYVNRARFRENCSKRQGDGLPA